MSQIQSSLRCPFFALTRVFLVVLFLLAPAVYAQVAGTGTIQGIVTDPTGAVIPNATVTLTESATQVKRVSQSDGSGAYVFPNINVGTYNLGVSAKGFQSYLKTGNVLEVGSNIAINAALTVGAEDQTVQVMADGLALQTEDVSFKQTIDANAITAMPLNGRQLTSLIVLAGGATPASGGDSITGSKSTYASISISIAGGQGNTTQWKLDGGDNNDYMSNSNLPFPFPDAVSQFSVESTALGAQNGEHSGGLVNVVTRSGTNSYHGSVFEFIRNPIINATNFFSTTKDSLHQNQFGGTLGGKILRDKLFAFGGYQRTISHQSQASTNAHIPTAANLLGDFSLSDPTVKLVNPLTGAALVNNKIDPTLFSPQAIALTKLLPNALVADNLGSVTYAIPLQTTDNQFVTRVDYTLNAHNNLNGRYFIDDYDSPAFYQPNNILVTTQSGNSERMQSAVVGEDYTISSNTINSAHVTLSRRRNNRGYNPSDINASDIGVTAFQAAPAGLYLAVGTKFTLGCGTCALAKFNDNFLAVEDEVTMVRGKHQIVFGGEWVHNQLNVSNLASGNGQFTLSGNYSANGPKGGKLVGDNNLDFLVGAMSAFTQSKTQGNALRGNIPSLYVQDTFHAAQRLTVVAGIRWSPEYMPVDYFNRGTTFSLAALKANQVSTVYPTAPAGTFFYGDPGVTRQFTQNSPYQFSPNFGVALDPRGDGKTVFRAGAEFIYDEVNWFTGERTTQNPPFATSVSQIPSATSGPLSLGNPWLNGAIVGNPFPLPNATPANAVFPLSSGYEVLPAQFRPANTMQWTASMQHQFGHGWQFQLMYIGNKTSHIAQGIALNPATYIPGVWGPGGTGCAGVVLTGRPSKVAPGAANSPCSTVANQSARAALTQLNPVAGPQYAVGGSGATLVGDEGAGKYNGLITTVQHRLSSTFSVLGNYTWSKCLNENDASGDVSTTSVSNPLNPSLDYGPCGSDYRHIANIVLVLRSHFTIPNQYVKAVVNGWEFGPLAHLTSGAPVNVTAGVDNSLTDINQDRPNVVLGVQPYIKHQILSGLTNRAYLNPVAFCSQPTAANPCTNPVASGAYGTVSRNSYRGLPQYQFDAQISRIFPIYNRLNAALRLEAFNVLNHPNFNTPASGLSSATFGQISGSAAARIFQGSVKLNF